VKQSHEIATLARRSAAYSAEVAFGYVGRVSAQARRFAPRNDYFIKPFTIIPQTASAEFEPMLSFHSNSYELFKVAHFQGPI